MLQKYEHRNDDLDGDVVRVKMLHGKMSCYMLKLWPHCEVSKVGCRKGKGVGGKAASQVHVRGPSEACRGGRGERGP